MSNYTELLAERARVGFLRLTKEQDMEILKAYQISGNDLVRKFRRSKEGSATRAYYADYIRSLSDEINRITTKYALAGATLPSKMIKLMTEGDFKSVGLEDVDFKKSFGRIPYDVVARLKAGGIYADGVGLSSRIWGSAVKAGNDLQQLIMAGMSQQISAIELSKMLEAYVDPLVRKTWDTDMIKSKLGEHTTFWNKNLEYNSLRLARTTITHASQMSLVDSADSNPYIDGLKWHLSMSHSSRMNGRRDICDERDGRVFPVKECPFDHPNGLCWQEPYMTKTLNQIGAELKHWVDGGSSKRLDGWAVAHKDLFSDLPDAVVKRVEATMAREMKEKLAKAPVRDTTISTKPIIDGKAKAIVDSTVKDMETMAKEIYDFDPLKDVRYKKWVDALEEEIREAYDYSDIDTVRMRMEKMAELEAKLSKATPSEARDILDKMFGKMDRNTADKVVRGNLPSYDMINEELAIDMERKREFEIENVFLPRHKLDSIDEYIREANAQMHDLLSNAKPIKRIDYRHFDNMLKETEPAFKSQFETGYSNGAYAPDIRADLEKDLFKAPVDLNVVERPIYGAMLDKSNFSSSSQYGDVCVLFDMDRIQDRTTITFGDSLSHIWERSKAVPDPLTKPTYMCHPRDVLAQKSLNDMMGYPEIQIHGGTTYHDIKEVWFTAGRPSDAMIKRMDELGIKWKIGGL